MAACRNGLSSLPCRLHNTLYLNAESEFRVLPIPPSGLSLHRTRSRRARPCPFSRGIRKPEPERRRRKKELDARTGTLYEQNRFFGGRRRPAICGGPVRRRGFERRGGCKKNVFDRMVCLVRTAHGNGEDGAAAESEQGGHRGESRPNMTKHDIS